MNFDALILKLFIISLPAIFAIVLMLDLGVLHFKAVQDIGQDDINEAMARAQWFKTNVLPMRGRVPELSAHQSLSCHVLGEWGVKLPLCRPLQLPLLPSPA